MIQKCRDREGNVGCFFMYLRFAPIFRHASSWPDQGAVIVIQFSPLRSGGRCTSAALWRHASPLSVPGCRTCLGSNQQCPGGRRSGKVLHEPCSRILRPPVVAPGSTSRSTNRALTVCGKALQPQPQSALRDRPAEPVPSTRCGSRRVQRLRGRGPQR